ncbi:hypothetical protein CBM2588_A150002 [Cupriavidus taiwanensis]|nr:hypothetical protein CBM2588_A150002 [Cupriavidus taiwanensis]SOZ86271.1 hypothetical protein CBM2621_A170002 [Cupriavidus taiwanensis]
MTMNAITETQRFLTSEQIAARQPRDLVWADTSFHWFVRGQDFNRSFGHGFSGRVRGHGFNGRYRRVRFSQRFRGGSFPRFFRCHVFR